MRRNGAENVGINQQPVQHFTASLRPHNCMSPSPARPSPAQALSGRSFGLLSPEALRMYCRAGECIVRLNPTCQPVGEVK